MSYETQGQEVQSVLLRDGRQELKSVGSKEGLSASPSLSPSLYWHICFIFSPSMHVIISALASMWLTDDPLTQLYITSQFEYLVTSPGPSSKSPDNRIWLAKLESHVHYNSVSGDHWDRWLTSLISAFWGRRMGSWWTGCGNWEGISEKEKDWISCVAWNTASEYHQW